MAIATPLQFSANRANAQRSTGPATAEGKLAASRNAQSHGLTSRQALLPGESAEAYQSHLHACQQRYQPQDEFQHRLVTELASLTWRIDRVPVFEASLIALEVDHLTTNPEFQPLVENITCETTLNAIAYRRLMESKVLPGLVAQEKRLAGLIQTIKRELSQQIENVQNEANLPEPVAPRPFINGPKVGRNDYCPCKSGLKYKRCCLNKVTETKQAPFDLAMAHAAQ